MNNRAQVIGQSDLAEEVENHAFFWERGTIKDLGTLGGSFSIALWLNDAGEVVGAATTEGDQALHASRWNEGDIIDLGTVEEEDCSFANAINAPGSDRRCLVFMHHLRGARISLGEGRTDGRLERVDSC